MIGLPLKGGTKMNQIKIGAFMKELRNDHNLTQEQLAEKFGVSQRSVSRWENGNTMPDISILIEMADYYEIDLREILNGERKIDNMNEDLKETLEMVADYTAAEKEIILKKTYNYSVVLAVIILFEFVAYIFNLPAKNNMIDSLMLYSFPVGLFLAFSIIIHSLQLKGKMDKESLKKLVKAMIPILVVLTIILVIFIIFVLTI